MSFAYCRSCEAGRNACGRIFDCWWERFDVVEHLRNMLPEEAFLRLAGRRPQPKLTSLIELIEQARASRDKG
ncbi:MAG: hypothetical protein ACOWWM_20540 [Desulfobacterales bacterium]